MRTIAKPIDMVCWVEASGQIHPIRFKIEDSNGEKVVCPVHHIQTTELSRLAGNKVIHYNCQVEINNTLRFCEIRYELDTCRWFLFKL